MKTGIWYTWDNEDNEIKVPVYIVDEFYEPGDPVPGYDLKVKETTGMFIKDKLIGGIDSRNVEVL